MVGKDGEPDRSEVMRGRWGEQFCELNKVGEGKVEGCVSRRGSLKLKIMIHDQVYRHVNDMGLASLSSTYAVFVSSFSPPALSQLLSLPSSI